MSFNSLDAYFNRGDKKRGSKKFSRLCQETKLKELVIADRKMLKERTRLLTKCNYRDVEDDVMNDVSTHS